MNSKMISIAASLCLAAVPAWAASDAEKARKEVAGIFEQVLQLMDEGDYGAALEELGWAREAISQLNARRTETFFPDELGTFTADGAVQRSEAMGISQMSRTYTNGSVRIEVSLLAGSGGAGQDAGLGGLAALGKMAMMQSGGQKFRLQRRTAMLLDEGSTKSITVSLNSGGTLTFETNTASEDELREAAGAFPVADLDEYRSGN